MSNSYPVVEDPILPGPALWWYLRARNGYYHGDWGEGHTEHGRLIFYQPRSMTGSVKSGRAISEKGLIYRPFNIDKISTSSTWIKWINKYNMYCTVFILSEPYADHLLYANEQSMKVFEILSYKVWKCLSVSVPSSKELRSVKESKMGTKFPIKHCALREEVKNTSALESWPLQIWVMFQLDLEERSVSRGDRRRGCILYPVQQYTGERWPWGSEDHHQSSGSTMIENNIGKRERWAERWLADGLVSPQHSTPWTPSLTCALKINRNCPGGKWRRTDTKINKDKTPSVQRMVRSQGMEELEPDGEGWRERWRAGGNHWSTQGTALILTKISSGYPQLKKKFC